MHAAPLPIPRNNNNLPALDTSLPSQSSSIPSSVPLSAVSPASGHHPSQDLQRVASYASDAGYFSGPELGTSPFDNSGPSNDPTNDPTTQEVDRQSFESDELEGLAEDRVVAQGYLLCLKNVSGVRQWKRRWVVLRGRSLTLYKNFEVPLNRLLDLIVGIQTIADNTITLDISSSGYRSVISDKTTLFPGRHKRKSVSILRGQRG